MEYVMKFSQFEKAILLPFNQLQKESGEEFLELMVDTIVLRDDGNRELCTLNGWMYSLSRSRHWDKGENIYIMYDGFTVDHLEALYKAVMALDPPVRTLELNVDGMNDLDEPIRRQIIVELNTIDE